MDSDDILAVSEAPIEAILPEVDEESKNIEEKGEQEFIEMQQLAKSPAWKRTREKFEEEIENFRSGRKINLDKPLAEIGEDTKVSCIVADTLQKFINMIDESIEGSADE